MAHKEQLSQEEMEKVKQENELKKEENILKANEKKFNAKIRFNEKKLELKQAKIEKKVEAHLKQADVKVDKAVEDADLDIRFLLDEIDVEIESGDPMDVIVFKAENILEEIFLRAQLKIQMAKNELIANLQKDFDEVVEIEVLKENISDLKEKTDHIIGTLEGKIASEKEELNEKYGEGE